MKTTQTNVENNEKIGQEVGEIERVQHHTASTNRVNEQQKILETENTCREKCCLYFGRD